MKLETGRVINTQLAVHGTTGWNKTVINIIVMWQAYVMNAIQSIWAQMEPLYYSPQLVLTNTQGLLNHNVPIQYIIQNIVWSQQKLLQIQLRSYKSGCTVMQQLTTEALRVCQCSHYVQQSLAEMFLKNW